MYLSVVIPCKDEAQRLPKTLELVRTYCARRFPDNHEILVIDDGSSDDTFVQVGKIAEVDPSLHILRHDTNHGKGAAVRTGMLASRGEVVLFSDADLSTPIEELEKLEQALNAGADIAISSRALPESLVLPHRVWYRDMLGIGSNWLIRRFLGMPFRDTQCGFKLFRRETLHTLFTDLRIVRWSFDIEVLYNAHRSGLRIAEIPVRWHNVPGSKLRPWDLGRCLFDLFIIRYGTAARRSGRSRS